LIIIITVIRGAGILLLQWNGCSLNMYVAKDQGGGGDEGWWGCTLWVVMVVVVVVVDGDRAEGEEREAEKGKLERKRKCLAESKKELVIMHLNIWTMVLCIAHKAI
jgi:hypothetical protein